MELMVRPCARLLVLMLCATAGPAWAQSTQPAEKKAAVDLRQDLGPIHELVRQQGKSGRPARALHRPLPPRLRPRRRRPGRDRRMEHPPRALRPAHHVLPQFPVPHRSRGQSAGARSVLRAPHRRLRGVVARIRRWSITVGKHSVPFTQEGATSSQRADHDRSQQPGQQHLVRPGIHARRQRVGPQRRCGRIAAACIRRAR